MRRKTVHGFQTGDRVVADIPTGKKAGVHAGRVAIRKSGSFNIQSAEGVVQGISYRYCRLIQRGDGYAYGQDSNNYERKSGKGHAPRAALSLPGMNAGVSRASR